MAEPAATKGGGKECRGSGNEAHGKIFGATPLRTLEMPILNIEMLPFEHRDMPNLDKK